MINKWRKKEEKKKEKKKNWKNIISFKRNKLDSMMKEKDRKKMSIKEKFNLKRKCVIVKSRMSPKERKFKRKNKMNLTIFL